MTKNRRPTFVMPLALALSVAACGSPPEPRAPTPEDASPSLSSRTPSPDRSPAKYRVSASPPGPGEWKIWVLVETCRGSCEQWTPAGDLPVYTCRASERGGVWSCGGSTYASLTRIGITDAQGRVRTKSPIGSLAKFKQQEVWKVFVPKAASSPVYRTENEDVWLEYPEFSHPQRHPTFEERRAWRELLDGLVELPELRFDTAFVAQVNEVESASRGADQAHIDRQVTAMKDSNLRTEVIRCRDTPTEAQCDAMLTDARTPGTSPERRAEAESAYGRVQPTLDTSRWNAASPSCRAPTNSGSCDAVKAYLARYQNGLHASEARQALSRAAPTLARLAEAEHAADAERRRERDAERQRVKEICLGQCRAAGTSQHDCWDRCD